MNVSPREKYVPSDASATVVRIIWSVDISSIALNNSQTNAILALLRVWLHSPPFAVAHARSRNAVKIIASAFARVLNAARNVNALHVEMTNPTNNIIIPIFTTQYLSQCMLELIYLYNIVYYT